ncbi:hypothetical protein [Anaerotignum sp.]
MGFLRKDWDWENPAEHDMEQPVEERKDRKLWLWGLALICGGLSIYALYHIENKIYGGAVQTNWASWLGMGIGTMIVAVIHAFKPPKEPSKEEWDKSEKILGWCFAAGAVVLLFVVCVQMPRLRMYGFQFLAIIPIAFGLEKAQKAGMDKNAANAWNLFLTFALLVGITLASPRIMGICTVAEAEAKLAAEGYYAEEYENAISAIFIDNFIPSATVELDDNPWDDMYYLFDLEGNNNSYVVVNPWTGEIIAE